MNKADIINEISRTTGIEKVVVTQIVEKFVTQLKEGLTSGENVYLRSFGSFIVKTRRERIARNISQNEAITIPERRVATFRPSRMLTEEMNIKFNREKNNNK